MFTALQSGASRRHGSGKAIGYRLQGKNGGRNYQPKTLPSVAATIL
jgi:hypothetical protein